MRGNAGLKYSGTTALNRAKLGASIGPKCQQSSKTSMNAFSAEQNSQVQSIGDMLEKLLNPFSHEESSLQLAFLNVCPWGQFHNRLS